MSIRRTVELSGATYGSAYFVAAEEGPGYSGPTHVPHRIGRFLSHPLGSAGYGASSAVAAQVGLKGKLAARTATAQLSGLGDLGSPSASSSIGAAIAAGADTGVPTATTGAAPTTTASGGFGQAVGGAAVNLLNSLSAGYLAQQQAKAANAQLRANAAGQAAQTGASPFSGMSTWVLLGGAAVVGLVAFKLLKK